jgi:hypothetical protein
MIRNFHDLMSAARALRAPSGEGGGRPGAARSSRRSTAFRPALAGLEPRIVLSTEGWMGENMAAFSELTLSQFTMPGSHSAGVSFTRNSWSDGPFIVTQSVDVKGQLERGSRYFDLRPTLYDPSPFFGPSVEKEISWVHGNLMGGIGERAADTFRGVREFLEKNPREIVFLHLQDFGESGTHFGGNDVVKLLELARKELDRWVFHAAEAVGPHGDVSTLTLSEFWNPAYSDGGTEGKVVLMATESLGRGHKYFDQGYLVRTTSFESVDRGDAAKLDLPYVPLYDETSKRATAREVISLQKERYDKLTRDGRFGGLFLLSWTSSPSGDGMNRFLPRLVRDLAKEINPLLPREIGKFQGGRVANILYIDYIGEFGGDETTIAIRSNLSRALDLAPPSGSPGFPGGVPSGMPDLVADLPSEPAAAYVQGVARAIVGDDLSPLHLQGLVDRLDRSSLPAVRSIAAQMSAPRRASTVDATACWAGSLEDRSPLASAGLVSTLWDSPLHREQQVGAMFREYLGRAPGDGELRRYAAMLSGGRLSEQDVMARILNSPEFIRRTGGPSGQVSALYRHVLGREETPAEMRAWRSRLDSGMDSRSIARALVTSPEFYRLAAADAYHAFLGREAEPATLDRLVGDLRGGQSLGDAMQGLLGSPEFQARILLAGVGEA